MLLTIKLYEPYSFLPILIVTFLALCTTNAFYRYAVHFMIFKVIMEFLVNAIKFIAFAGFFIIEIYFGFSVAIDTPSHA